VPGRRRANDGQPQAGKVRCASLMLQQHETLRALGGGSFHTLMRTMFTDLALMLWLGAEGSTARAPNENLARESMESMESTELFSLEMGNYTETDVRQAALAITGWRLDRASGVAGFSARGHATGPETSLGENCVVRRGFVHVAAAVLGRLSEVRCCAALVPAWVGCRDSRVCARRICLRRTARLPTWVRWLVRCLWIQSSLALLLGMRSLSSLSSTSSSGCFGR
jgi:uncharacterized protein (DUF1800 family)